MSVVCVTVGRGSHKSMIAEYHEAAAKGAKLVELRVDLIRKDVSLDRLLEGKPAPVVITCRRPADGGMWRGDENKRLTLWRTAIAQGVDYVDLEEDAAAKIPRYGKTKRIISYHNFVETPPNLADIHARLAKLQADVVKIAVTATSPKHLLATMKLVQNAAIPTIAFCMGEIGSPTRVMLAKFGGPFSYASHSSARQLAPGQFTFDQMRDLFRYESIDADTEFYGVVADPVAHSLSPHVHNAAFEKLGLNKVYLPFRCPMVEIEEFVADCPALGVRGLSVTIPHKERVLPLLATQDEAVLKIGACNTMLLEEGQWRGMNTDHLAAMAAVDRVFPTKRPDGKSLHHTPALVLGAGGASKAIVHGLKQRGADVLIASRTDARAEAMAIEFGCKSVPWALRNVTRTKLIVNCTPVGMHPNVNDTPYEGALKPEHVVFDTVYNPEQTLLIKNARNAGATTITGVEMFVGQAALQFKQFAGAEPPPELMANVVRRQISAAKY